MPLRPEHSLATAHSCKLQLQLVETSLNRTVQLAAWSASGVCEINYDSWLEQNLKACPTGEQGGLEEGGQRKKINQTPLRREGGPKPAWPATDWRRTITVVVVQTKPNISIYSCMLTMG